MEAGEITPETVGKRRASEVSGSDTREHSDDIDVDLYTPIAEEKRAKRRRASTVRQPASGTTTTTTSTGNKEESEHSRTVYLGQLPTGITYTEIFDAIKTGPVESVRLLADKDCAFVDFCQAADAERFRVRYRGKRLSLRGQDVKVSAAKPSHLSESVVLAMQWGATRNIYFSGITIDPKEEEEEVRLWERRLREDCARFGPVDVVKVVPEKGIAFVHMARVVDAMEAVGWMAADPAWRDRRVNFGTDRCGGPAERPSLRAPPCLRTVYLGGIPKPECTLERVCQQVHGGLLDTVKVIPDKQSAFVTFVRPEDARRYHDLATQEGVTVGGTRVKVAWASERALSMPTIHGLQRGATRCICIDNLDPRHTHLPTLLDDLTGKYKCEVETAWKGRKDQPQQAGSVFISFASIKEACEVLDGLRFDRAYHGCRVSFARDRCSIPAVPKPVAVPGVPAVYDPSAVYPQYPVSYQYPPYPPYQTYPPYPPYPPYQQYPMYPYGYPPPPPPPQ